jgi:hypothetical protein
MNEWIKGSEIHTRESSAHREAFTLKAGWCGRHRDHLTVDCLQVWLWDPWQGHGIGADGWHTRSLGIEGDRGSFPQCKDTCIRNIPDERPCSVLAVGEIEASYVDRSSRQPEWALAQTGLFGGAR